MGDEPSSRNGGRASSVRERAQRAAARERPSLADSNDRRAVPYERNWKVCGFQWKVWKWYVNRIPETGSCYWLSTWRSTFYYAKWYCEGDGAILLVLDSEHERRVVRSYVQEDKKRYEELTRYMFIGIRTDDTRVWYTVEGDLLDDIGFAPWAAGEPDNYGGWEECLVINTTSFEYYDKWCRLEYSNFVCKKRAQSELTRYT
ncbi:perlucin-like [Leguminivora glycinivorella]|uniref:perlucin-like n=1 Tax=Leguminivora glycinivorella TaxID=1035111 RepID=UPI002010432D|nr:perlucin-like [Leguminivora glycinivorella]